MWLVQVTCGWSKYMNQEPPKGSAHTGKITVVPDSSVTGAGTWRWSRYTNQEPSKGSAHTGIEASFLGVFAKKITYTCIYLSICHFLVSQSCPTLCHPMDCSLPGSSVCGISPARVLECTAISFYRGSSWPRDRTCVSCIGMQILYCWATWEVYIT